MNFAPSLNSRASVRHTGAVYTPAAVAKAVTALVGGLVRARSPMILEPSIGDGAFVEPLAEHFPSGGLVGVDVDAEVVAAVSISAALSGLTARVEASDFIEFALERWGAEAERFDLSIGNPPFVRKHNFSPAFKAGVARLAELADYPLSGLKNTWAAFLVASTRMLRSDGVAAFVVPNELMTVAYGKQLLRWLGEQFERIDLFVSDEKAFPEIDQDAIIFVGQKTSIAPAGVFIQHVSKMSLLDARQEHAVDLTERLAAVELNRFLIPPAALALIQRLRLELPKVSDCCSSAPGVVTAANEFFILTEARASELGLSELTLPILKKGSLTSRFPVFTCADFDAIAKREPCRLLSLPGDGGELPREAEAYLRRGEENGFNRRYKCRTRRNWFEVPLVPRAEGFIFKRSHAYPRMCINEASVYLTDTAYGLKPLKGRSMRGLCFSFYNSLTLLFSEIEGRFYGGGVLELSPNEFRGLPLVYHEPSDAEFEAFLAAHSDPAGLTAILDFGDEWLGQKLSLGTPELKLLRESWRSVQSHRMRHGKAAVSTA